MDGWNTTFLLGRPIFRGVLLEREGKVWKSQSMESNLWILFPHKNEDGRWSHECFRGPPTLKVEKHPRKQVPFIRFLYIKYINNLPT